MISYRSKVKINFDYIEKEGFKNLSKDMFSKLLKSKDKVYKIYSIDDGTKGYPIELYDTDLCFKHEELIEVN